MLTFKNIAIVLLVWSDIMIYYNGMKYATSSGDPKYAEQAKIGLLTAVYTNLGSLLILFITSSSQVNDWFPFGPWESSILYCFVFFLFLFIIGIMAHSIISKFLSSKKTFEKIEDFMKIMIFIGLIFSGLSFQLFLGLITF